MTALHDDRAANDFTADERKFLEEWFDGFPVSRYWLLEAETGLVLHGFVANSSAEMGSLELRLDGKPLPNVGWRIEKGPGDAPAKPGSFHTFLWRSGATAIWFHAEIPFERFDQEVPSRSLNLHLSYANGDRVCDPVQDMFLSAEAFKARFDVTAPPASLMHRAMGVTQKPEWLFTGGANYEVFNRVVQRVAGRSLSSMGPFFEWGSGCGRLSRHLIAHGIEMTGVDIDAEAVAWCQENLAGTGKAPSRFVHVGTLPPTPLPSASFNGGVGVSVMTHLDEKVSLAWLEEIARLLRPDAIMLLTTHGYDTFSAINTPSILRDMQQKGIALVLSGHLNDVLGATQEYYYETWHSWEYIRSAWARWFEVLDIKRGGHMGFQDLVVLRRR